MALIVSVPVIANWAEFAFNPGYAACVLKFHKPSFMITFLTLDSCLILIPCMATITGCYFKVSRAVREHNLQISTSLQRARPTAQNGASVEEIRGTKTLFLLVSSFAISWIPAYAIEFLSRGNLIDISPQGTLFVTYLVGLNPACNPFIYGYMNRSFRREFWKLVPSRIREKQVLPGINRKDMWPRPYIRGQAVATLT